MRKKLPTKEELDEYFEITRDGHIYIKKIYNRKQKVGEDVTKNNNSRFKFKGGRYLSSKFIYYYFKGVYPDKIFYKDFNTKNYAIDNLTIKNPVEIITKELLDQLFIFDKDTGKVYYKIDYFMNRKGDEAGHLNNKGYFSITIGSKHYLLHHIIWFYYYGYFPKKPYLIDHIDRNSTNNKLSNLRLVTKQENSFNREVKGYSYIKNTGKYKAEIMVNGKKIRLGIFATSEEAREAYLKAKEKYHKIPDRNPYEKNQI